MTKARTKAQRRRKGITLPGGQNAPQRPTGRDRRHINQPPEEPANNIAITARLRKLGLAETEENRDIAKSPMAGCAVGRAILSAPVPDGSDKDEAANFRNRLWNATKHLRRVRLAYDRACGAPHRHAQCLRVMAYVDAFEADSTTPPIDLRTPEERDRTAVNAWMAVQGWLGYCDKAARSIALLHIVDELDREVVDWPAVHRALDCVADGLQGNLHLVRTA